jgi:hypothetical protein
VWFPASHLLPAVTMHSDSRDLSSLKTSEMIFLWGQAPFLHNICWWSLCFNGAYSIVSMVSPVSEYTISHLISLTLYIAPCHFFPLTPYHPEWIMNLSFGLTWEMLNIVLIVHRCYQNPPFLEDFEISYHSSWTQLRKGLSCCHRDRCRSEDKGSNH